MELKLMRELGRWQSNQSKKAEIVNYYYQWQISEHSGKKKGKEERHNFCENTKRDRGERYFERYCRNGSSLWFHEIKMNPHAFMSINHMRAGHSSLKASLSRFNIVCTAECESGDGLQMEQHIFWDCKLCEDQRATMMNILSENSKKDYPMSVKEILRLEKKRFVQGVCYLKQNSYIYLKRKGSICTKY
jgi:hypothetical protein